MTKLHDVRAFLEAEKADLAVFSDPVSISYLTGFASDPHERHFLLLVFRDREPLLFLPELEMAAAAARVSFPILGYQDAEDPWAKLKAGLRFSAVRKVFAEFDHLNLTRYQGLRQIFPADFSDLGPFISQLKLIKSPEEIASLRYAGSFADRAMAAGFDAISLEASELDIVAQIEYAMKKAGVRQMSFDTMVLSGANAANPHGLPGSSRIQNNALLLFDLGTENEGYCSDITRTVAVGQPDTFQKDIYQICLEAQLTALDFIRPGVTAAQVDAAARQVIEKAGFGQYFNHRLGHGIGTTVHEFPSIMAGNDLVLEKGMAFSVEPGIYIPGKAGVRIEDCGVVTETGFELCTETSKDLLYF